MSEQNRILTEDKIDKILKRIAIEVIENNFHLKELIIIGIVGQGFQMVSIVQKNIKKLKSGLKTKLFKLDIDKQDPDFAPATISRAIILYWEDKFNKYFFYGKL